MKRAAIITIYPPEPNYGNKLQNYASMSILRELGLVPETIITEPQPLLSKMKLNIVLNAISGYKLRGKKAQLQWKRRISFAEFSNQYLKPSYVVLNDELSHNSYDFYFVGSDQVWNPRWYGSYEKKKELFLLSFANPSQMICMAPSFGVDHLPVQWEGWFREKLARFNNISVREQAGADIIYELTGKKAEVVIDPTMMLDVDDWNKISKSPHKLDTTKPYILTYFLGKKGDLVEKTINDLKFEYCLNIYHLNEIANENLYSIGPSEFIYMISHASIVLTDSFHASVFSFLYERPFLVFPRDGKTDMMSRIDTLLERFDLRRKYVFSGLSNDVLEHDYSKGKAQLEIERKRARSFLIKSLRGGEKDGN